jgi:glycosyltransferase involved in cell wall biosynthesis
LEETIRSVLLQGYLNLEYIVIDGASNDGSVDIIQKYANRLTYWSSEPDQGQYDAINKGFARATGEVFAWINSDDKYIAGAFQVAGEIFATHPEVEWLTTLYPILWDEGGRAVSCNRYSGFSGKEFYRGANLPERGWFASDWIQQESTFWRRSLWERAGGLDLDFPLAGDFELWARFFKFAELYGVATILAGFRLHSDQKTAHHLAAYTEEAERALRRHGGRPYGHLESLLLVKGLRRLPWPIKRLIPGMAGCKNCYYGGREGGWVIAER